MDTHLCLRTLCVLFHNRNHFKSKQKVQFSIEYFVLKWLVHDGFFPNVHPRRQ